MDNQHQKIKGYRDLSQEEIDLMNVIKAAGERLGGIVDTLQHTEKLNQRWVAIGQTHLEQGIMALVRAVAQPTTS